MKIKNLFLAGFAALALTACSDDQPIENGPDGSLKGYISLDISAPQTKTNGTGETTDPGIAAESNISSVTIVLTTELGAIKEAVQVSIDPTAAPTLRTVAAQVSPGSHYVYALVNYPGSTADLTGNIITKVINVAAATEATSGYKNGSFLMVNEFNGTSTAGVPAGGVQATILPTHNTAANALNVAVKVDRVASKIVYKPNAPTVTGLAADATSSPIVDGVDVLGFAVLNVNKDFNLVQKWEIDGSFQILSTPSYANGFNASSQYWHHIGDYTTLTKVAGAITEITDNKATNFGTAAVYTTENRPAYSVLTNGELTAGKGETTGLIYKVQAKKGTANAPTFYKFLNTVTTDYSVIKALPTFASNANVPATVTPVDYPKLRALGIQVYEDGIMYYTHFIKDINANHRLGGKNYYSVFRNSVYELTLNSISKIGDDVPGGSVNPVDPDPTKPTDPLDPTDPTNPPIDEEEAYINVTVTINPWVLNAIGVDF